MRTFCSASILWVCFQVDAFMQSPGNSFDLAVLLLARTPAALLARAEVLAKALVAEPRCSRGPFKYLCSGSRKSRLAHVMMTASRIDPKSMDPKSSLGPKGWLKFVKKMNQSAATLDTTGVDAATAYLKKPRATSGVEAFQDSAWSVMMDLPNMACTLYTAVLAEDGSVSFTDSSETGSWECDRDWVVIEKPQGFFKATLYLTARLLPSTDGPWRLVDGIVELYKSSHEDIPINIRNTPKYKEMFGDTLSDAEFDDEEERKMGMMDAMMNASGLREDDPPEPTFPKDVLDTLLTRTLPNQTKTLAGYAGSVDNEIKIEIVDEDDDVEDDEEEKKEDEVEDEEVELELRTLGTWCAHEFTQSVYKDWGRFKGMDEDEEDDS